MSWTVTASVSGTRRKWITPPYVWTTQDCTNTWTQTLPWDGYCVWGTGFGPFYTLSYAGSVWTLYYDGQNEFGIPTPIPDTAWNCFGSNTFTLAPVSDDFTCHGTATCVPNFA